MQFPSASKYSKTKFKAKSRFRSSSRNQNKQVAPMKKSIPGLFWILLVLSFAFLLNSIA